MGGVITAQWMALVQFSGWRQACAMNRICKYSFITKAEHGARHASRGAGRFAEFVSYVCVSARLCAPAPRRPVIP
eukprot:3215560-Pleurochrysis_carterae.AAC.4